MNSAATALEPVEQSTGLPKVVVVGTGGTIHSVGKNSLDIVRYGENKTMYDVDRAAGQRSPRRHW